MIRPITLAQAILLLLSSACSSDVSSPSFSSGGTSSVGGSGNGSGGAQMAGSGGHAGGPGTNPGADGGSNPGSGGSGGPPDPECTAADTMLPADADNPCIQLSGRWDRSDPKAPVARWGAVYITAKFEGTSIKAHLVDERLSVTTVWQGTTYELGPNSYQVSIDGGPPRVFAAPTESEYTLASGLSDGPHTVTLVRRSESKFGKTIFLGFSLDAGKSLLVPGPRPTRRIEVFGDSITAGLANENTGPYNASTQNGYEAYGTKFARLVNAEWHVQARGGGSFYTTYLPMVPWFDKTFGPLDGVHKPEDKADDAVPVWDFADWQPHVLIIALGTNDASDSFTPPEADYIAKYGAFLGSLRRYYPEAWIFALAPWKEGAPWDVVRRAIASAAEAENDARIQAIVPVDGVAPNYQNRWLTYPADYVTGDEYHPNLAGHHKIARKLQEIIAPIVGF
jgi:lysophospholipase L1-like esterase